jgi:hypothetical protein
MASVLVRHVTLGDAIVRLEVSGDAAARIVDFLFPESGDEGEGTPDTCISVSASARGTIDVTRNGVVVYRGGDAADAARATQESVTEALASSCAAGLVFHAAAVSLASRAVLLPGATGSGKTTLTAHCIALGFRYLTDELSLVAVGSHVVRGAPRPLHAKASGRAALPDSCHGWSKLSSSVTTLLQAPASTRVSPDRSGPRLAMVVFPRHEPATPTHLEPITRAECGLGLMATLLNARNLSDHGFGLVAALARRTPAFRLRYGDASSAARILERHVA